MRNMSFSHTIEQMLDRSKSVTRRIGWVNVNPGDMLQAVEKGQGLKRGERVRKLGVIRVLSMRRESLGELLRPGMYGFQEMAKEGFPELSVGEFIARFFSNDPATLITRIEFEHVLARLEK